MLKIEAGVQNAAAYPCPAGAVDPTATVAFASGSVDVPAAINGTVCTVSFPADLTADWATGDGRLTVRARVGGECAPVASGGVRVSRVVVGRVVARSDLLALTEAIRVVLGATSDPAGAGTLRAIKNTTNSDINASPAQYIKGLNQACINLAQAAIQVARVASG